VRHDAGSQAPVQWPLRIRKPSDGSVRQSKKVDAILSQAGRHRS
jgi:hypothetical protein